MMFPLLMLAQGWPSQYQGVMLQGFYWDSYSDTRWTKLEAQADELAAFFDLVWIPQSGDCGSQSMGYDPLYWFPGHYNSSFGTEAQLRSMISTFKGKGLKAIADVVVNHRKNLSTWTDFPAETYKGVTYQLTYQDICKNDEAAANGQTVGPNNDTGEGWDGMRDLDHMSTNVQQNVKAYVKMLIDDLGYAGFRYDMVKGYAGKYTQMYNEYAAPEFSVGECWDGTPTIRNWIDAAGKTSAAFDFQFRYTVRNAISKGNWQQLGMQNDGNWPLVSSSYESGNYRRYAVTFVENHDTEYRSATAQQDPIRKDTLAANAYLLAMPGTPCVFLKHWQDYKREIKLMIDARKLAGITNESSYTNMRSNQNYYANLIKTNNQNRLQVVVGSDLNTYVPSEAQWVNVLRGYHYAYYLPRTLETAWVDTPSGEYDGTFNVKLTAVSATDGAQLVYTTNGTTPTASSTKVSSGSTIQLSGDVTLKVGLLVGGSVSGIITRHYTKYVPEATRAITIHVQDPGWSQMYFYAWSDNGELNGGWPGKKITDKKTVDGKQWYYQTFELPESVASFNIIFDKGAGGGNNQTVDITGITGDKYYVIGAADASQENKFTVSDVTATTAIEAVRADVFAAPTRVYTVAGRLVRTLPAGTPTAEALDGLERGLYIIGNKKHIK